MSEESNRRPASDSNNSDIRHERSPVRNGLKAPDYRERSHSKEKIKNEEEEKRGREINRKEDKENESEMMGLMGFGSFGTTKNKHVEGVGNGAVKKNKKAKFRQYMNREKGFNRELSPERRKR